MLIDTNVFLEHLLDQTKADQVQSFLEQLSKGSITASTTTFTIHAVEGNLTNKPGQLQQFLTNLQYSIGLTIHDSTLPEETQIASNATRLDFDDQLHLHAAQQHGHNRILSYDTDFDDTTLQRITPYDLIQ